MKKLILSTIAASLALGAYANDNPNQVELIVKYKKSANTMLMSSTNSAEDKNYSIVKQINPTTAIVSVQNTAPQSMTLSTNALGESSASNNAQDQAYATAKAFMDKNPNVLYAIPKNSKMSAYQLPSSSAQSTSGQNVSSWDKQWDMENTKAGLGAEGAWDYVTNGNDVTVAVVDSGLAPNAPKDITKKLNLDNTYYFTMSGNDIVVTRDITDNGSYHGTHVAGTIAADGPNVSGVAGPVNGVTVMPVRALGDDGSGSTYAILDAVKWAAGGMPDGVTTETGGSIEANTANVKVINLSLGMSRINPYTNLPQITKKNWEKNYMGTLCPAWKDAIDTAYSNGVTVVIAAGNDGHSVYNDIPAGCNFYPDNPNIVHAIVVEASGPTGKLSSYSTYSDRDWGINSLFVRAPGGDSIATYIDESGKTVSYGESGEIYSTMNGGYGYMQGTSMATPHVAGLVSLIYSLDANATPSFVQTVLKNAANPQNPDIVNAQAAVEYTINSHSSAAA